MWFFFLYSLSLAIGGTSLNYKTVLDITRFRANVLPTCLLTTLGAPSIHQIHSQGFAKAFTMVHLLTSASMVINDIYDQPFDRINHPDRPLVTGRITEKEAWTTVGVLSVVYGALGLTLPSQVAPFWIGSWVLIMAYTPVLKKICFVKNLACALTVAATVPFMGGAVTVPFIGGAVTVPFMGGAATVPFIGGASLLVPLSVPLGTKARFVFAGSLYCEVLMDILDKTGDAMAGIRTLPVLFGNPATLGMLTAILALLQISLYRSPRLMVLLFPLYVGLWRIHRGGYCPHEIKRACKQTTGLLLVGNLVG